MKQKIEIKVQICCDKCRTKALKIAASADGVASVALEGSDKNKVVVVGEGVDAAELTSCLRKKFKCTSLESVVEVKPEKKGKKDKPKDQKGEKTGKSFPPSYDPLRPRSCEYHVVYDPSPPYTCSIL